MTLENECALSFYTQVATISEEHGVYLVQHRESRKFYVKKTLAVYDLGVYQCLQQNPVVGMPRIYEAVESDDGLIVIEEYLAGSTLAELLREHGPYPEAVVAAWMCQLCAILHTLHSAVPPIIHRDIKPSNIILSADGCIKLLDMDAARRCDESKRRDTVLMGTAGYAAPEQYGFEASGVQTDIYAVGVLINELNTGALLQESACTGRLAPIVRRCTRIKAEERYADVDALARALAKLLPQQAGAQPRAAQPTGWRRFLPPGFRGNNPFAILGGVAGYAMLISAVCAMKLSGRTDGTDVLVYRIMTAALLMCMILFSGNYLGVQRWFPLCRSDNLPRRIVGIVLADFIIFFAGVALMALVLPS